MYQKNYILKYNVEIRVLNSDTLQIISEKQLEYEIYNVAAYFNSQILQVIYTNQKIEFLDLQTLKSIQVINFSNYLSSYLPYLNLGFQYFGEKSGLLQLIDFNNILWNRQFQFYDSIFPQKYNLPAALFLFKDDQQNQFFSQSIFFYYNYNNFKLCAQRPVYILQDNLENLMKEGRRLQMNSSGNNLYVLMESTLFIYFNITQDKRNLNLKNYEKLIFEKKIEIELIDCCKQIYYPLLESSIYYLTNNNTLIKYQFKDNDQKAEIIYQNYDTYIDLQFYESGKENELKGEFWLVILEQKKLIVFDLKNKLSQTILEIPSNQAYQYKKMSYYYEWFKQRQNEDQIIFQKNTKYSQLLKMNDTLSVLNYVLIARSDSLIQQVNFTIFSTEKIPIKSEIQFKFFQYRDYSLAKDFKQIISILVYTEKNIAIVLSRDSIYIYSLKECIYLKKIIPHTKLKYKISISNDLMAIYNEFKIKLFYFYNLQIINIKTPVLQIIEEIYILQSNLFLVEGVNYFSIFSINQFHQEEIRKKMNYVEDQQINYQSVQILPDDTLNMVDVHYVVQEKFIDVHSIEVHSDSQNSQNVQVQVIACSLENFLKGTYTILIGKNQQNEYQNNEFNFNNACSYSLNQASTYTDSKLVIEKIRQIQVENLNLNINTQKIVYYFDQINTFSFMLERTNANTNVVIRNNNQNEVDYYLPKNKRVKILVSNNYSFEYPVMYYLAFQHVFIEFEQKGAGFQIQQKNGMLKQLILNDALVSQKMDQVSFFVSNIESVIIDGLTLDGNFTYTIINNNTTNSSVVSFTQNYNLIGLYNITNVILTDIKIQNFTQIESNIPLITLVDCKNVTIKRLSFINNVVESLNSIVQSINVINLTILNATIFNNSATQNIQNIVWPPQKFTAFQLNATLNIFVTNITFANNTHFSFLNAINSYQLQSKESLFSDLRLQIKDSKFTNNNITSGMIQIQFISVVNLENLSFRNNTPFFNEEFRNISFNKQNYYNQFNGNNQHLILFQNVESIDIKKCRIIENEILGSMIYLFSSHFNLNKFVCKRNSNLINSGGCLYIYFTNEEKVNNLNEINHAIISSNSAIYGEGGGIYINTSDLKLTNTNITNNTALVGGGVKYVETVPRFLYDRNTLIGGKRIFAPSSKEKDDPNIKYTNLIFENNAQMYGNNIGSVLTGMRVELNQSEFRNFRSGAYLKQSIKVFILDEEGSSLRLKSQFIEMAKQYQTFSFIVQITDQFDLQENFDLQEQNQKLQINGKSIKDLDQFDSIEQAVKFNVSFTGFPSQKSKFIIKSSQITKLNLENKIFEQGVISLYFDIEFRDCKIGEIYFIHNHEIVECQECKSGKLIYKYQIFCIEII